MSWDDKKDKGHKGRNNPWGRPNDPRGDNGFGGGPSGRAPEPPDLDEALKKLGDNIKGLLPGNMQGAPLIVIGALALVLIWLASGFYVVNPGENAVIQRFGAWNRTQADPGLGYHFPAPIESASVINVQEIRKLNIGYATEFYGRAGSQKRGVPEESLMLTSDRNIIDLDLEVQWNIKSAEDYLFEIKDQEATIKKVAESAIREIVGQTPMFQTITNQRQQVADRTKAIIQANLDEYNSGVNITQVLIQKAEVHPDVQNAFQDVQSAKQDAEDVQNRARAYREDILPKARGQAIQMTQQAQAYREATIAKANGDADRFTAIYSAYLSGKDVTKERLYLETMEDVLKNAHKIILGNEASQGVVPYLPLNELKKRNIPNTAPAAGDDTAPARSSLQ